MIDKAPSPMAGAAPTTNSRYQPIITRAVARLSKNTGPSRKAVYERARATLMDQLRGIDPPLSESEIMRERSSLEAAIGQVEDEVKGRANLATPLTIPLGAGKDVGDGRPHDVGRLTLYAVIAVVASALLIAIRPEMIHWLMIGTLIAWIAWHSWQSRAGRTAYAMAGLVGLYAAFDLSQGGSRLDAMEGAGTAAVLVAVGYAAGNRSRWSRQ